MRLNTKILAVIVSFVAVVPAMPARASNVPVEGTDYFMTVSSYTSGETTSPTGQIINNSNYYVGDTTITIYADNAGVKGNVIATYLGFCIDFQDQIHTPDTYLVVAQDVGAAYNTSLGGYSDFILEKDAALGNMFNGVDTTQNPNDAYVNIDIWDEGGAWYTLNTPEWNDVYLAQDAVAAQNSLYTGYTNDIAFEEIGGDGQSFMVDIPGPQSQTTVTPEPGSLILLGTGLLSTLGTVRRRFQRT